MAERKPISKKLRFEVFKRDSFRCQYCGRSAPDVILEVDHIVPVAKGGKNDVMNLITSCRDCNRGKGKKMLTENEVMAKQKAQLDELNERREQMEMMIKWRTDLKSIERQQVDAILERITELSGFACLDGDDTTILKYIKRFSFQEVYDAVEISFLRYIDKEDPDTFEIAMNKVGGVCYNRRKNNGLL